MKQNDNKIFFRQVFALVLPMALQNLINTAINSADVFMLQLIGEDALSGASLAGQVQFIMALIFFGLCSGSTVLTAQYWGRGDKRTVEKVLGLTTSISAVIGLLFFLAAFCFPVTIMGLLTNDPDVIREGASYLRIIAFSYPLISFSMIYLNIMRSVERVVISTVVYSISLVVNIGLNLLFIKGWLGFPMLGTVGVAVATLVARAFELGAVIFYSLRMSSIRWRIKYMLHFDRWLVSDFFRYSSPVILNELLLGLGIALGAVVIGHMGSEAIAAQSVTTQVRQLAMVISIGIANATAVILGKSIGGGNLDNAKSEAKKLITLALISGLAGALLLLLLRPVVPYIFTNLSALSVKYLKFMLLAISVYTVARSVTSAMIIGVFRSGGDTRFALFVDLLTLWCVSLLGAYIAYRLGASVELVFCLIISDEVLKIPIIIHRYKSGVWLKNITRATAS